LSAQVIVALAGETWSVSLCRGTNSL
jgi:hypothetical protein